MLQRIKGQEKQAQEGIAATREELAKVGDVLQHNQNDRGQLHEEPQWLAGKDRKLLERKWKSSEDLLDRARKTSVKLGLQAGSGPACRPASFVEGRRRVEDAAAGQAMTC